MYSADISHSSIVADKPRFSKIGLSVLPSSFKSSKFCILRAPTWITSTSSTKRSILSADIISVMIGSPVTALASFNKSSPVSCSPWKEYGEVRGLKAPPRRIAAPICFTSSATPIICSRVSTEQGPAITVICLPPTFTPHTSTMLSSGWNILLARL